MIMAAEMQVLVATRPVDFRKQADGLAAIVQAALGANPFCGAVYVFRSKRMSVLPGATPPDRRGPRRAARQSAGQGARDGRGAPEVCVPKL